MLTGCAGAVIVNPSWDSLPDGDAMSDAYPLFATLLGAEGQADLHCGSDAEGRLINCRVLKTSPTGMGFDRAALSVVPRFRLNPRQVDGRATKGSVEFPIYFRLEPEETPPPWTGPEPSPDDLALARRLVDEQRMPMFSVTHRDPTVLEVEPDRAEAVAKYTRQVQTEFNDQLADALARAMARLLTHDQLQRLDQRRPFAGAQPSREQMIAAFSDAGRVNDEMQRRMRELYCASYACPDWSHPRVWPTPANNRSQARPDGEPN